MTTTFFYVYVLRSEKDGNLYTGYTSDLRERLRLHSSGQVAATRSRRPVILIYYEACRTQTDATSREKYLKSALGKRYLKNRLRDYLTG
jgi:putative endonuclease